MREIAQVALCALLHDIGKPLLRYWIRAERNLEQRDQDLLNEIMSLSGERSHEALTSGLRKRFERDYGFTCEEDYLTKILSESDRLAAAERGFSKEYARLRDIWDCVEERVRKHLPDYTHYVSPLLSPLWIIDVLKSNSYHNILGPLGRGKRFDYYEALRELRELLGDLEKILVSGSCDDIAKKLINLIARFRNKRMWFPVKLLSSDALRDLSSRVYDEAVKEISYRDIVRYILRSIDTVTKLYPKDAVDNGLVETINEVLRYSLMLVPSAIYIALAPDISLYSHSKLVASYATSYSITSDKFRLLVLDARGIQEFISAPTKAKAASRVIRGRSLLVELFGDALVEYVLKVFRDLPRTNVISDEGGSIIILIPGYDDAYMQSSVDHVKKVLSKSIIRRGFRYSIAYSRIFGSGETDFLRAVSGQGGFEEINENLGKNLLLAKTVDDNELLGVDVDSSVIDSFDAITQEIITRDDLNYLGFKVDDSSLEYANAISGNKLEIGDSISSLTHMSLVAGSLARNLYMILSIHMYKTDEQGRVVPAVEELRELRERLCQCLHNRFGGSIIPNKSLYFNFGNDRIGVIPLEDLGGIYLLVSAVAELETLARSDVIIDRSRQGIDLLARECLIGILEDYRDSWKDLRKKIRVRLVNIASEFIRLIEIDSFRDTLRKFIDYGFDLSLTTFFTGTYHPVVFDKKENKYRLKDLDEYNLIAVSKIDGDSVGEIRLLLSLSPSRLVTFSDLLTTIVIGKTHLMILSKATATKEALGDVIMLYAGGDDASFYGDWLSVLNLLYAMYRDVFSALYPLSFTSAIYIDRSDTPLLEIYRRTIDALDELKRRARGSVVIKPLTTPQIISLSTQQGAVAEFIEALPVDDNSRGWIITGRILTYKQLIEALGDSDYLKTAIDLKRDLYALSRIAYEASELLRQELSRSATPETKLRLLSIENTYTYYCVRRGEDMNKIEKKINKQLCYKLGEDQRTLREALAELINTKTLIDLTLLKTRTTET